MSATRLWNRPSEQDQVNQQTRRVPFAPADNPKLLGAKDLKGPKTTMLFPRRVNLRLDDNSVVTFEAGPREVPNELVNHWYLKANGVTSYSTGKTLEEFDPEFVTIARQLWQQGRLDAFVDFVKDPKLGSRFEEMATREEVKNAEQDELNAEQQAALHEAKITTDRGYTNLTPGSENYGAMQARVERDRLVRSGPGQTGPGARDARRPLSGIFNGNKQRSPAQVQAARDKQSAKDKAARKQ